MTRVGGPLHGLWLDSPEDSFLLIDGEPCLKVILPRVSVNKKTRTFTIFYNNVTETDQRQSFLAQRIAVHLPTDCG